MELDNIEEAIGSMGVELENIKSELVYIGSNTSDIFYLNRRLDRIIELLEKIVEK